MPSQSSTISAPRRKHVFKPSSQRDMTLHQFLDLSPSTSRALYVCLMGLTKAHNNVEHAMLDPIAWASLPPSFTLEWFVKILTTS